MLKFSVTELLKETELLSLKATDCKLICRFVKNESTPVKVGCKAGRKQLRAVANDAQEAVLNDLWAAEDAAQMVLKQLKKAASEMAWIEQSSRAINDALLSLSVSVLYPDNYASPKDMVEQIVGKVEADIVKIIRGWPPLKKA